MDNETVKQLEIEYRKHLKSMTKEELIEIIVFNHPILPTERLIKPQDGFWIDMMVKAVNCRCRP